MPRSYLVCIPIERARRLHRRGQPAVKVGRRPPHAIASQPLHHIGRVLRGDDNRQQEPRDESKTERGTMQSGQPDFSLTQGQEPGRTRSHTQDGHAGSTLRAPLPGAAGAGGAPSSPFPWSISCSSSADGPPSTPLTPTPTRVECDGRRGRVKVGAHVSSSRSCLCGVGTLFAARGLTQPVPFSHVLLADLAWDLHAAFQVIGHC